MLNKISFISFLMINLLVISSCQNTQLIEDVVFDNSLLNKITVNSENKEINVSYESSFDEPFIDHVMETHPTTRIISWLENNVSNFGTENKLVIDIQNASITRKDIDTEIKVSGIVKKQNEYLYELNLRVFFILYNDSSQILATTKTEVFLSTTSNKFISLNERNQILDNLTKGALKELSNKSVELLKLHMSAYIL
ncbi:MAG: hypothetical protein CL723_02515 [Chloroflexi bacterium]|nr:hypothetical protein [Chloroflexota bacterium]